MDPDTSTPEELKEIGNLFFQQYQYSFAIERYSLAITRAGKRKDILPALHSNLTACYLRIRNYEKAEHHAQKAIEFDPKWPRGYFRLIQCYTLQKKTAELQKLVDECLQKFPQETDLFSSVMVSYETVVNRERLRQEGTAAFKEGQFELAAQKYKESLDYHDDPTVASNLSLALTKLSKPMDALLFCQRSVTNPSCPPQIAQKVYTRMGSLLEELQHPIEALAALNSARAIQSTADAESMAREVTKKAYASADLLKCPAPTSIDISLHRDMGLLHTQRRILYEQMYYYYPIGNTPAVDLYRELPRFEKQPEASVLQLGCGDIRHVLLTLYSLSTDKDSQLKRLSFTLNDYDICVLARNLIMLHLVTRSNGDELSSMISLLSKIWFSVSLTFLEHTQLMAVLDKFLTDPSIDRWAILTGGLVRLSHIVTYEGILATLRFWRVEASKVTASELWLARVQNWYCISMKTNREGISDERRIATSKWFTGEDTYSRFMTSYAELAGRLDKTQVQHYAAWGAFEPIGSNDLANPTMVRPRVTFSPSHPYNERLWTVHYDLHPYVLFGTDTFLSAVCEEEKSLATAVPPVISNSMHRAVLKLMTRWVVGTQVALKKLEVSVDLISGDASQFGNYRADPSHKFDLIDCGNTCDHAGLLPVLLAVQPLLSDHPSARLLTQHLITTDTLSAGFTFAGVKSSLLPSLFGYALVTDDAIIKDCSGLGSANYAQIFRWRTAPRSCSPLTLTGSDDLSKALLSLISASCSTNTYDGVSLRVMESSISTCQILYELIYLRNIVTDPAQLCALAEAAFGKSNEPNTSYAKQFEVLASLLKLPISSPVECVYVIGAAPWPHQLAARLGNPTLMLRVDERAPSKSRHRFDMVDYDCRRHEIGFWVPRSFLERSSEYIVQCEPFVSIFPMCSLPLAAFRVASDCVFVPPHASLRSLQAITTQRVPFEIREMCDHYLCSLSDSAPLNAEGTRDQYQISSPFSGDLILGGRRVALTFASPVTNVDMDISSSQTCILWKDFSQIHEKLEIAVLPLWPKSQLMNVSNHLNLMFAPGERKIELATSGNPQTDLKESLYTLFVYGIKGHTAANIVLPRQGTRGLDSVPISMLLLGIYRTPHGAPLLHIAYLDEEEHPKKEAIMYMANRTKGCPVVNQTLAELALFRAMLRRNSARMLLSSRTHTEIKARQSFILPLYATDMLRGEAFRKLLEMSRQGKK